MVVCFIVVSLFQQNNNKMNTKKLIRSEREIFQFECYNMFLASGSYSSIDEYIELLGCKMLIRGVKFNDPELVMNCEELEDYRENVKWFFSDRINRTDITLELFNSICEICFDYSKSHKPLIW